MPSANVVSRILPAPLVGAYVYKIMRLNDQSLTRQLVQKRDFTH